MISVSPRVLIVFSQKGGSGKSAAAINLAVFAHASGTAVAIFDLDDQKTSLKWAERRGNDRPGPVVVAPTVARIGDAIEAAKNDGISLVIIDAPPHAGLATSKILEHADLVVVPIRPTSSDIDALPDTQRLIGKKSAVAFLSQCALRSPEVAETRGFIEENFGWQVAGEISTRVAVDRARSRGLGVSEFEPAGASTIEIEQLYNSLMKALK